LSAIKIYNTLTQKKEIFTPLCPGQVSMYVCGITVYDHAHIGHARAAIIFDTIYRYFKYRGFKVTYVRNFTDIDDKIINRANQEGVSWKEVAERYIQEYTEDIKALGNEPPTYEPRAAEHIPDMIKTIERLIEKGYAYELNGDVYFEVGKFNAYGKLSKKNLDEQLVGARVEMDERKKDPRDFALWKKSKPGEPSWPSPWGEGRPGWHIECSVMSQKYLGDTIDIHGGGQDLIFPHHENEIAQAEAATGKPFVRYWIHNGFVNINQEKMSKSLGNIFTIKEILKEYHPEVVRLFLLSHHYRSPLDFSAENLREAEAGLERIYRTLAEIDALLESNSLSEVNKSSASGKAEKDNGLYNEVESLISQFEQAMDDDFNTALALGYFHNMVRTLNRFLSDADIKITDARKRVLAFARTVFSQIGNVLGLFQSKPAEFLAHLQNQKLSSLSITIEEIEKLIAERSQARKEKNWKRADEIRAFLLQQNILLEDDRDKTTWKVK